MFDFAQARQHMVESQIRTSDVTDLVLLRAFRDVEREKFVPKSKANLAYADLNIATDSERALMRPREFAKLVQLADIKPTDIVLDIGCGRGYSAAIMSRLAETIVAIEDDADRVERATNVLIDTGFDNVAVLDMDLSKGASEHGPYNVIFVNGAVETVPQAWIDQLADGGRLVCVVQKGPLGQARLYTKSGDVVGDRVAFDAHIPELPGFKAEEVFAL